MIKMESLKPSLGFKRELKIESNEKVTISFMETTDGDVIAYVFKGIGSDIEDWHEPIGIYSSRNEKNAWITRNHN